MKGAENIELYHRIHLWDFFEEKIKGWVELEENW